MNSDEELKIIKNYALSFRENVFKNISKKLYRFNVTI